MGTGRGDRAPGPCRQGQAWRLRVLAAGPNSPALLGRPCGGRPRRRGIRVVGAYPGGIDTDVLAGVEAVKADPRVVAARIVAGIDSGATMIWPTRRRPGRARATWTTRSARSRCWPVEGGGSALEDRRTHGHGAGPMTRLCTIPARTVGGGSMTGSQLVDVTDGWPERLQPGALRWVRSSSNYDRTSAFDRDLVGLPIVGSFSDSFGEKGTIFGLPDTGTQMGDRAHQRAASPTGPVRPARLPPAWHRRRPDSDRTAQKCRPAAVPRATSGLPDSARLSAVAPSSTRSTSCPSCTRYRHTTSAIVGGRPRRRGSWCGPRENSSTTVWC